MAIQLWSVLSFGAHQRQHAATHYDEGGSNDLSALRAYLREILARYPHVPCAPPVESARRVEKNTATTAPLGPQPTHRVSPRQSIVPGISGDVRPRRSRSHRSAHNLDIASDFAYAEGERPAALGLLSTRVQWKLFGSHKGMLRRIAKHQGISPREVKRDTLLRAVALTLAEDQDPIRIPPSVVFTKEGARLLIQRFGRRTIQRLIGGPVRPCDVRKRDVYWAWFVRRAIAYAKKNLRDLTEDRSKGFQPFERQSAQDLREGPEKPVSPGHEPDDPASYFVDRVLEAIDTEHELARHLTQLVPGDREAVRALPDHVQPLAARALPILTRKQRPILLAILRAGNRAEAFASAGVQYSAGRKMVVRIGDRLRRAGLGRSKTSLVA